MQIRYMTKKDLPAILQITAKEGWISDIVEFQMFLEFNPLGCFVCVKNKKVIGSVMTFSYAKSSWIGNLIVAKEHRGEAIGKKLLSSAIEYLDKMKKKQIYLNAALKAKGLYEKFGFKKVMQINRWQGRSKKSKNSKAILQETIPETTRFIKLDTSLWRDERGSLIFRLSSSHNSLFYPNSHGFIMYKNTGKIITIGPWELKGGDEDIAEKLFVSSLSNLKSGKKIFLDIPSTNKTAKKILTRHNFIIISSTIFMCRGKLPRIHFNEIFSFATMGSMG